MKNMISEGNTLRFTAGSALSSGDLVQVGKYNGVMIADAANGATDAVCDISGVYNLPKKDGETHAIGDQLFINGDGDLTKTDVAPGLQMVGLAHKVAASGDLFNHCKLEPDMRAAPVEA